MPESQTPIYGFAKWEAGDRNWGASVDGNFDQIETLIHGNSTDIATMKPGSDEWLIAVTNAQAWSRSAVTYDSNGAMATAAIVWPDGTAGTYTTDTVSSTFAGYIDAFHVTYGTPTVRTVTVGPVTRDSAGRVTAASTPIVS